LPAWSSSAYEQRKNLAVALRKFHVGERILPRQFMPPSAPKAYRRNWKELKEERIMRTVAKIAATLGVVGAIAVGSAAPAAAWYGYHHRYYHHHAYYPYYHRHYYAYYPYYHHHYRHHYWHHWY
jgi:hypothetical protein